MKVQSKVVACRISCGPKYSVAKGFGQIYIIYVRKQDPFVVPVVRTDEVVSLFSQISIFHKADKSMFLQ